MGEAECSAVVSKQQSALRWRHLCSKRVTLRNTAREEGWGEDRREPRKMEGCRLKGTRARGCTQHGAGQWGLWCVTSQSWWLQAHYLGYFSRLFFKSIKTNDDRTRPSCPGAAGKSATKWKWNLTFCICQTHFVPTSFKICIQNLMTCKYKLLLIYIAFIYCYLAEILGIFASYHKSFLEWGGAQKKLWALTHPSFP